MRDSGENHFSSEQTVLAAYGPIHHKEAACSLWLFCPSLSHHNTPFKGHVDQANHLNICYIDITPSPDLYTNTNIMDGSTYLSHRKAHLE